MSDDLEQRLQQAFHRESLPPAPASLVDALAARTRRPSQIATVGRRRSCSGCSRRPLLVTPGSLGHWRFAPADPPDPTDADPSACGDGLRLEYQLSQQ